MRNQNDIKWIKINDLETKLLQFADDTTVLLLDLDSTKALFVLLHCFEKVSGLKLNFAKTEAISIGSLQNCEIEPLGVKWKKFFFFIFIKYHVQTLNFDAKIYGSQVVCQFMARLMLKKQFFQN